MHYRVGYAILNGEKSVCNNIEYIDYGGCKAESERITGEEKCGM